LGPDRSHFAVLIQRTSNTFSSSTIIDHDQPGLLQRRAAIIIMMIIILRVAAPST
jgi:hypothetical protein